MLDPCCGTGAYLAEVLRCIAANLKGQGLGALVGARVKHAAIERVFGFEIMPAPFVVAHLQVGHDHAGRSMHRWRMMEPNARVCS